MASQAALQSAVFGDEVNFVALCAIYCNMLNGLAGFKITSDRHAC